MDSVIQSYSRALELLKVSILLQQENDPGYLLLQVAALLHRHGVRLLREWLPDLGEVAVAVEVVLDLAGVVDEGEGGVLAADDPLEALLRRGDHARVLDHLVDVGVLLPDGVVPHPVPAHMLSKYSSEILKVQKCYG